MRPIPGMSARRSIVSSMRRKMASARSRLLSFAIQSKSESRSLSASSVLTTRFAAISELGTCLVSPARLRDQFFKAAGRIHAFFELLARTLNRGVQGIPIPGDKLINVILVTFVCFDGQRFDYPFCNSPFGYS